MQPNSEVTILNNETETHEEVLKYQRKLFEYPYDIAPHRLNGEIDTLQVEVENKFSPLTKKFGKAHSSDGLKDVS